MLTYPYWSGLPMRILETLITCFLLSYSGIIFCFSITKLYWSISSSDPRISSSGSPTTLHALGSAPVADLQGLLRGSETTAPYRAGNLPALSCECSVGHDQTEQYPQQPVCWPLQVKQRCPCIEGIRTSGSPQIGEPEDGVEYRLRLDSFWCFLIDLVAWGSDAKAECSDRSTSK